MDERRTKKHRAGGAALTLAAALAASPAAAQTALDRVDPAKIEATLARDHPPVADNAGPRLETPATQAVSPAAPITVGAITLSGLQVLHPSDFADIFEIYVGRTLSPPALAGLADAIAQRLHERGYVLGTAEIPAQPLVAGVLRVEVSEGAIDAVRLRGAANPAVERALAPLVGAGPVTLAMLERRLLIAGDIDGLWIRRTRLVREGGRNILEVEIGVDRVAATLGIDNSGSRPIGPIQADATVSISHVLAADDVITVSGLATPTQPSELGYVRVRYGKRVSAGGTEIAGSFAVSRTHPGAYLLTRDIDGRSWTGRIDVLQPVIRQRDASLWLSGSLGMRNVEQDRANLLARRDRLTVARIGASGFADVAGGRLRASTVLSQGLDWFGATNRGDPLASRSDADGTFTTLALNASWTTPILNGVSAELGVASQLSAQPLLVSEEIGLGGGEFLRGYDYSERSGDQGAMASGELRWAVAKKAGPIAHPILYGFIDGGRVTNLQGGFGSGTLFSTGLGLRSQIARALTTDLGVAVPLSGARYDSGTTDPVVNFRVQLRF